MTKLNNLQEDKMVTKIGKNDKIKLSFRILSQDRNTLPKIIDKGTEIDSYQPEAQDILSKIARVSKRGKKLISKSSTNIYARGSEFCIEAPTTEKDFTGQRNVRFMVYGKLNPNSSEEMIDCVCKDIIQIVDKQNKFKISQEVLDVIEKGLKNSLEQIKRKVLWRNIVLATTAIVILIAILSVVWSKLSLTIEEQLQKPPTVEEQLQKLPTVEEKPQQKHSK